MANRIPIEFDLALSFWARLVIIEQFSLAIMERSLAQSVPKARNRRRRNEAVRDEGRASLTDRLGASYERRPGERAAQSLLKSDPDGRRIFDESARGKQSPEPKG